MALTFHGARPRVSGAKHLALRRLGRRNKGRATGCPSSTSVTIEGSKSTLRRQCAHRIVCICAYVVWNTFAPRRAGASESRPDSNIALTGHPIWHAFVAPKVVGDIPGVTSPIGNSKVDCPSGRLYSFCVSGTSCTAQSILSVSVRDSVIPPGHGLSRVNVFHSLYCLPST